MLAGPDTGLDALIARWVRVSAAVDPDSARDGLYREAAARYRRIIESYSPHPDPDTAAGRKEDA